MTREVLQDGESYGIFRGKCNANFLELYTNKLEASQVLTKTNTLPYTPVNPYNPSTKSYVDVKFTFITDTYDPQGIGADAFVRSNHTGLMPADALEQDATHRLITDAERISWNGKEPAIGDKGTAFNKNYGTSAGTTAEGNHNHTGTYEPANENIQTHITSTSNPHGTTKAQVNLANVDDIGDANRIYTDYNGVPVGSHPTQKAGRIFYDSTNKALTVQSEVTGVCLSVGQESYIRVWNDTGVTIPNGAPLRYSTQVNPTTGELGVVLAQADDINHSRAICVATHDIPDGSVGYATRHGIVRDVDTSSFASGDVVYLSDTVAGGYKNTAPDITTIIGVVGKSHATEGEIYVRISINVITPQSVGGFDGCAGSFNLTATYQNIYPWTTSVSVISQVNATTGMIATPETGLYRITSNITLSFTSLTQTRTITAQLWDATNSVQVAVTTINVPKDAITASRSFSKLFNGYAGHQYVLRMLTDTDMTVTFSDVSLDIQRVHVGVTFEP